MLEINKKLSAVEEQFNELSEALYQLQKIEVTLNRQLDIVLETKRTLLKEKYENLNIVHGLYLYLKSMEYPLDIYNSCGIDSGKWDKFKHVEIKAVYNYDYTDIIGLTKKQFRKLQNLIEKEQN